MRDNGRSEATDRHSRILGGRVSTAKSKAGTLPGKLCRGHQIERVETARRLFARREPRSERGSFKLFLDNDCTVIMLAEQNRSGQTFPPYLAIDNPDAELFPNGGLIGWKRRKPEREFLTKLHQRYKNGRCRRVRRKRSG